MQKLAHQIERIFPHRSYQDDPSTDGSAEPQPKDQTIPTTSSTNNQTYNMTNLAGKIALVTGGSKGIGRATCLALAKAGASVVVNYSSDAGSADAVVKEIGQERALAVKADAGSVEGAEQMVKSTLDRFGKLDILIANAGILPMKDIENTTEADFDAAYRLNVKGPYFLVQKAAPHMSAGSHIVLLSTTLCHASTVTPNYLLYCSTKGAIEQMTKVLSKDLGRKGVSVNAVAPGPTGTELFYKGKSEQVLNMIAGFNPHNRIGTPEEVADACVFLSGEGSRWVTGQVLGVNGGMASV
ncbi:uncharacterized protein LTR77_005309 [Saxophila tyrrhenica]|uniref:NAD(P)-binding protein n=1 Tax=Saxophila tyrrhenica TaxID=1690608 RepID=A0AAV9P840_9PEZI|nr:hypothetical protein LTR77_005309 [Saxophila tyrrhenica]